jgi:WD40 repeat protein
VQATVGREIKRISDPDARAWWMDARSLVQRCRRSSQLFPKHLPFDGQPRSGDVWQWLQAASQEPDIGPMSRRAAATARILRQPLVCWPGKPQIRSPDLCTLKGHLRKVSSVAYSPDGKHVVSGSSDTTVKIWDAHTGEVVGADVSHFFTLLSYDCPVLTADRAIEQKFTLTELSELTSAYSVAYSPDSKHVVVGSYDRTVKIWDAQTGKKVNVVSDPCHIGACLPGAYG